jgi:hypothetical protein
MTDKSLVVANKCRTNLIIKGVRREVQLAAVDNDKRSHQTVLSGLFKSMIELKTLHLHVTK